MEGFPLLVFAVWSPRFSTPPEFGITTFSPPGSLARAFLLPGPLGRVQLRLDQQLNFRPSAIPTFRSCSNPDLIARPVIARHTSGLQRRYSAISRAAGLWTGDALVMEPSLLRSCLKVEIKSSLMTWEKAAKLTLRADFREKFT
ncbi:hypothetical protein MKL09_16725 [Methylobacterium sp. J-048]|uniref:hypothetical protein n=1 Tax=Methylobacterium sp. J-048 TaxID=2836635 RepID=UPI001FB8DBA1|nr:hypothetical protein [Methylobacterium sp. J-048]MCJ2058191.1 hypothetical protein [Methylobacterium sp. J-048]